MNVIGIHTSRQTGQIQRKNLWNKAEALAEQLGQDTVVLSFSEEPKLMKPAYFGGSLPAEPSSGSAHAKTSVSSAIATAASLVPGCTFHVVTTGDIFDPLEAAGRHGVNLQAHKVENPDGGASNQLSRSSDYFNISMGSSKNASAQDFIRRLDQAEANGESLGFDEQVAYNFETLPSELSAPILTRVSSQAAKLGPTEYDPGRYAVLADKMISKVEGRQSDEFGAALVAQGSSFDEQIKNLEDAAKHHLDQAATLNDDRAAQNWFNGGRKLRSAAQKLTKLKGTDAKVEQQKHETKIAEQEADRKAHIRGIASHVETEVRGLIGDLLPQGSRLEFRETEQAESSGWREETTRFKGTLNVDMVHQGVRSSLYEFPAVNKNSQSIHSTSTPFDRAQFSYKVAKKDVLSRFEA